MYGRPARCTWSTTFCQSSISLTMPLIWDLTGSDDQFWGSLSIFCLVNFSLRCTFGAAEAHGVLLLAGAHGREVRSQFDLSYVTQTDFGDLHAKLQPNRLARLGVMLSGQTNNQTDRQTAAATSAYILRCMFIIRSLPGCIVRSNLIAYIINATFNA